LVPSARRIARLAVSLTVAVRVGSVAFAYLGGSVKQFSFCVANYTFLRFGCPIAWEGAWVADS